eukprot:12322676-Alexandrium_andersonii.AAC.1
MSPMSCSSCRLTTGADSAAGAVAARSMMCQEPCPGAAFRRVREHKPTAASAGTVAALWIRPRRPAQTSSSLLREHVVRLALGAVGVAVCSASSRAAARC